MAKKGGASGYGEGDNVHSGSGSKGKGAHIPSSSGGVVAHDGGDGRTKGGAGASDTEKTHNVEFAKGGDTPMFGEQEAGSRMHDDKSPSTGKPDSSGPGEKFAEGGSGKMFAFNPSVPAQAGITSAR